jgi:outer membrane protein OmpA-like peptidoglycan-associated protein
MKLRAAFVLSLMGALSFTGAQAQGLEFTRSSPLLGKVNSPWEESRPVISPDGRHLYFTYRFHPDNPGGKSNPGDIWVSTWNELYGWEEPQHAGELWNNAGYNALQAFFDGGNRALLTTRDQAGRTLLAVSTWDGSGWTAPEILSIQSFYNRSGHLSAAISEKGEVLILAMHSFGSQGNEDLYISYLQNDGSYSKPEPFSPSVNTPGQELYPMLYMDTWLFFSSNRAGGQGEKDIYLMKRQGSGWGQWSVAQNMGTAINTPRTESGLFVHPRFHLALLSAAGQNQSNADLLQLEIAGRMPEESLLADSGRFGIPKASGEATSDTLNTLSLLAQNQQIPLSEDSLEKKITEEKTEISPPPAPPVLVAEEPQSKATQSLPEDPRSTAAALSLARSSAGLFPASPSAALPGTFPQPGKTRLPQSRLEQVLLQVTSADENKGLLTAVESSLGSMQTDEEGRYFFYRLKGENTTLHLSAVGYQSLSLQALAGLNTVELEPGKTFRKMTALTRLAQVPGIRPAHQAAPKAQNIPAGTFWMALDLLDAESGLPITGLLSLQTATETFPYSPEGRLDLALPLQKEAFRLELSAPGYQGISLQIDRPGVFRIEMMPSGMNVVMAKALQAGEALRPALRALRLERRGLMPSSALYSLSLSTTENTTLPTGRLQKPGNTEATEWEQRAHTWVSMEQPGRLKVLAPGHFPQWMEAESWAESPHQEISLEPIRAGENFVLSRLVFEQGTINFSDSTVIEELDRLVDMMQSTQELEILLTGYTDNQGIVRDNMELSRERADAVKAYLVSKGVEPARIEAQGLGPSNPIASNANPETRALNRRVECTIVKASN